MNIKAWNLSLKRDATFLKKSCGEAKIENLAFVQVRDDKSA